MGSPERTSGSAKVLIVDDNLGNLVSMRAVIEDLHVQVLTAESGYEALALAETHDFAVVLMDVRMPGIDGIETLARLRMLPRHRSTPVIVMTAMDHDPPTMRRAYACGAADSVAKPIHSDVLLQKVRVFISLWQKSEALITKDRYMGMLAHDLRTPLFTATMAATRLLDHTDPDVRALGARIARATTRMQTLTEDVLEFARATATQLPLERSKIDLAAVCRELFEDLRATHTHIDFSWELPDELTSECDRARFQQALSNLLDNAIKYGNGWVRMRVQPGPHEVEITIENAGAIAPEQAERLFAPFTRGNQDKPGVGLGLYIVREIARAHGGDIEVTASQQSTLFRLRLPIVRTDADGADVVQVHSVITVTPEHGTVR